MALVEVTLDDKYTVDSGRIFLTGIQALVRLPLIQRRIDQLAGLNTAGYITGYRGSPLGSFDQQLVRAADHLQTHHVRFNPRGQRGSRGDRSLGDSAGPAGW